MRTAFITGGSSDIGLALCRRYLEAGWRVIAHYRTPRPELQALACPALETWRADLADTAALSAAIASDPAFFRRADALISLAAAIRPVRFETATAADLFEAFSVNLLPGLLLMQVMGPAMVERGFGRIVHASSIGVKYGGGGESFAYSLSKHTQEFIPNVCRKWASSNVFVNAVRVGVTDTRFHDAMDGKDLNARVQLIPARRPARPEEMAETLFWLGSDANGFTTGEVITAAGGE